MKPHDTFLELAAIAIDFPLTSSERGRVFSLACIGRTVVRLQWKYVRADLVARAVVVI